MALNQEDINAIKLVMINIEQIRLHARQDECCSMIQRISGDTASKLVLTIEMNLLNEELTVLDEMEDKLL